MQCTQCNSDNVQRLAVIYEGGTQKINTRSRTVGSGVGFGSGGLGLGLGSASTTTTGQSQSVLAKKAAPPQKKSYLLPVILVVAGLLGFGVELLPGFIVFVAVGLAVFLGYRAFMYNKDQYPPKYAVWEKSWHCNRCGIIYTV